MANLDPRGYALEYEVQSQARSGRPRFPGGPPLAGALIIIVFLVVLATLIQFFEDGWWGSDTGPNISAAGGCLDLDVEPAMLEPTLSQDVAEQAVRQLADDIPAGDVKWAEYGYVVYPGVRSAPVTRGSPDWAFVFEDELDERWWQRIWRSRDEPRFTAIYDIDREEIRMSCGGGQDDRGAMLNSRE